MLTNLSKQKEVLAVNLAFSDFKVSLVELESIAYDRPQLILFLYMLLVGQNLLAELIRDTVSRSLDDVLPWAIFRISEAAVWFHSSL